MNLLLFPFSVKYISVAETLIKKDNITEVIACTPKAWNIGLNNICVSDGILLTTNITESLEKCDTIQLLPCGQFFMKSLKDIAEKALKAGKKVICSADLPDEYAAKLKEAYNDSFMLVRDNYSPMTSSINTLIRHDSIVVGIGELFDKIDDISLTVNVTESFKAKGYRVLTISKDMCAYILGYNVYLDNIFRMNENEDMKIRRLNSYISELENKYNPDIIVLQFPDGMLKVSPLHNDGFGTRSFMLSQAVMLDHFMLITPQLMDEFYTDSSLEKLNRIFSARYGIEIDSIFIKDIMFDAEYVDNMRETKYITSDAKNTDRLIENISYTGDTIKFYPLHDKDACDAAVDNCIDILSSICEEF